MENNSRKIIYEVRDEIVKTENYRPDSKRIAPKGVKEDSFARLKDGKEGR